jgi:ribosomal protein L11 methylase PrmA
MKCKNCKNYEPKEPINIILNNCWAETIEAISQQITIKFSNEDASIDTSVCGILKNEFARQFDGNLSKKRFKITIEEIKK